MKSMEIKPLLKTNDFLQLLRKASQDKESLSLARFGHGELSYMNYKINSDLAAEFSYYQRYCGATISYDKIQEELIEALRITDVAGLFTKSDVDGDHDHKWIGLTEETLKYSKCSPKRVCSPWIPKKLAQSKDFWEWLKFQKVVLVGRRVMEAKEIFLNRDVDIVNCFALEGFEQINSVQERIVSIPAWIVVILSAGVPATVLAPKLARAKKCIAIDFGHTMDWLIDGDRTDHERLVKEWNEKNANKD